MPVSKKSGKVVKRARGSRIDFDKKEIVPDPSASGKTGKKVGTALTTMKSLQGVKKKRGTKPGQPVQRKYDWEYAKDMFITSTPMVTLKEVSRRTGIPYDQVRQKSSKERWQYLRAQEQAEAFKKKRTEFTNKMAGESIKFDENAVDTAKLGMNLVTGRLIEISKQFAAAGATSDVVIEKLKQGVPVRREELYSVINYKELRELSLAALTFQELGRKALGTDIDKLEINVDTTVEQVVSIGGELQKDDPERLAKFLEVLERTGLTALNLEGDGDEDDDDGDHMVIPGEVVETKAIEGGNYASTTDQVPEQKATA